MQSSLYRRVGHDIRRVFLFSRRKHRDDLSAWNTVPWIRTISTTNHQFHYETRLNQSVVNLYARTFHYSSYFSSKFSGVNLAPVSSVHSCVNDDDEIYEKFADDELGLTAQSFLDISFQRSLDLELGDVSELDDFRESDDLSDDMHDDNGAGQIPEDKPKSFHEILAAFQRDKPPPPVDNFEDLESWLECASVDEYNQEIQKSMDSARRRRDYESMGFVQKHIVRWVPALREAIAKIQSDYLLQDKKLNQGKTGASVYGPIISRVPPDKLAVIAARQSILSSMNTSIRKSGRVPYVEVCRALGQAVEDEIIMERIMREREEKKKKLFDRLENNSGNENDTEQDEKFDWTYGASHLKEYIDDLTKNDYAVNSKRVLKLALARTRRVAERDELLTIREKIQVGAILFHALLTHATSQVDGKEEKVFRHEIITFPKKGTWNRQAIVSVNESFAARITSDDITPLSLSTTRYKPMVVPPKPWTSPDDGGYLFLKAPLMRVYESKIQQDVLHLADLTTLLDGLNVIGRVPWKVNGKVLEAAERCWVEGIPLGEIPTHNDFELPPKPEKPAFVKKETETPDERRDEWIAYKEESYKYNRVKQRNNDLVGLRCTVDLKINQAKEFMAFDKFYYPYNVDFRGRTYPIPPHFSTVGSDLCRGMLKFADSKPLGKRGLYWLKVHLANLAGHDKVMFEERAAFVDENMERVRKSAEEPFEGESWWRNLDDPFQGLATCIEIINAIDSGNPESYLCSLPVHMDGSCNGLQHYAALGLDLVGGKAVNLCPEDKPQDVYSGVMHEVIRRVSVEAQRQLDFDIPDLEKSSPEELQAFVEKLNDAQRKEFRDHRAALLVDGLIDRGVVKRTVMTNVYGVTLIGARDQIREKIQEKLLLKGFDIDSKNFQKDLDSASGYLARLTMGVMGDLFVGARSTMKWLAQCARLITQHGYPVAWISPIGVPVIQPYRSAKSASVVTVHSSVKLNVVDELQPLHKSKQVSAFPPNFVHSLDSSHMVLTALEMDRRGLSFAAVHDSYWTHPCDVDEMNTILREVFVDLYSRPILSELKESWEIRYPDIEFPDVPEQGELDLDAVKSAQYFFQ